MATGVLKKAVVILGPTATHKSKMGIALAQRFPFEIISADSMQFYKGMDIGTDKVPESERAGVPHHLLDIITVEEEFSIADFKRIALKVMGEIYHRGNTPLIVGGSGLYIRTLTENFPVEESAPPDKALREKLSSLEINELRVLAEKADFEAASKVGRSDRKRLIRIIEYVARTGRKISEVSNAPPDIEFLKIGLIKPRDILYRDIEKRIDEMFEKGFIEEVKVLQARYKHWSKTALQAIGYKEVLAYLSGEISIEEAKHMMKLRTRHLAKRQVTWFKKEENVHWIDSTDFEQALLKAKTLVLDFLNK
jgi:tRNA dimethylallyltransferase